MTTEAQSIIEFKQRASSDYGKQCRLPRRSLRFSEILDAPVHDFPIRDEILHQYTPPLQGLKILEVGPGSGFTAYSLLPHIDRLTLVDFTETTLTDLRQKLGSDGKTRFIQADICQPGLIARVGETYDFVFGLDMFECVSDGARGLENLAAVTNSGGVMFLTFPNFPPPRGQGLTWYTHRRDLEESLARAGFQRWEISCVWLRPYANTVFRMMHEWPLNLYRRLRKKNKTEQPQTYESTWAFQNRDSLQRMKPLLHVYWTVLGVLLRLGGAPFLAEPAPEELRWRQLVVIAWR
jgi:SAM-dependent methyltransferase